MLIRDRPVVEVAVDSVAAAEVAAALGADRLEVAAALELGGLTPTPGLVREIRARVAVPLFAMVRPRAGDFHYRADELAVMLADLPGLLAAGAEGIVTGATRPDGSPEPEQLERLVRAAGRAPVTYHRAFDLAPRPWKAIELLIELGFARLLTAGGTGTAFEGRAAIARAVKKAAGRLIVMAGGGITGEQLAPVLAATGVGEIHLAGCYHVAGAAPGGFGLNSVPNPARLVRLFEALAAAGPPSRARDDPGPPGRR